MKKASWIVLSLTLSIGFGCIGAPAEAKLRKKTKLWPAIKPYATGFLKVSDIHEIYYELCGNAKRKPVFVLHGGPGAGCSPYMRRFFNPKKFLIVLHDQRGAGRSRPYAEIRQNTTQNLVEDIEHLRKHLRLQKIIIFGGSWGTTLGLAYAETYPENVMAMVLRGIFTATKEEIDDCYRVNKFFPEAFNELLAVLPEPGKRPLPTYLFELLQSEDRAMREKYSTAWAKYALKTSMLEISDEQVNQLLKDYNPYAMALLENYYLANRCFLGEDQLLRNVGRIRDIPTTMVNGRYDVLCPPIYAYRLHQELRNSKLIIAEKAGHWMGDKPLERALLKAMREFE